MGGNNRKKTTWGLKLVEGILLSLGIYLAAAALTALLAVQAVMPETWIFPCLGVGSCLAAWAGGIFCRRESPWGHFPGAMACVGGFLLVLTVVALLCWEEIAWLGRGGALLVCGGIGGLLSGLVGGRKSRRKDGRRVLRRHQPKKVGS